MPSRPPFAPARAAVALLVVCAALLPSLSCAPDSHPLLPRSQTWAELRTIRRSVSVTPPEEAARPPHPRERLVDGEAVSVAAEGLAWLRRDGGATLLVRGLAELTLRSDAIGVTSAAAPALWAERLALWLSQGRHGNMAWMADTRARRADPRALWSEAKSVIILAVNYGPDEDPLGVTHEPDKGAISVYARHRDYHDVIKGRLKTLGSWLFLGAIFVNIELEANAAEEDHCGSCRACLDACPTNAFPAPYQLDARRCISYLTIEHPGPIPREFRAAIGNRIYGCDDCLAVCPWNKFASLGREAKLSARDDLKRPALAELAALDEAGFRAKFAGGGIKRIGHARFLRNVMIAVGNSGEAALLPAVRSAMEATSPLVRGAAVWALRRLAPEEARVRAEAGLAGERDEDVRGEWEVTKA